MNTWPGTDRRAAGDLSVDERLERIESKLESLYARMTYLMGAIATGGVLLSIMDIYLRTRGQ